MCEHTNDPNITPNIQVLPKYNRCKGFLNLMFAEKNSEHPALFTCRQEVLITIYRYSGMDKNA